MSDQPVPPVPVDQQTVFYKDGEEYVTPKGYRYRQVNGRWKLVARPGDEAPKPEAPA